MRKKNDSSRCEAYASVALPARSILLTGLCSRVNVSAQAVGRCLQPLFEYTQTQSYSI